MALKVVSSNYFKQELCVEWAVKVDDFLNRAGKKTHEEVCSDTFSADFSKEHKWKLSFYVSNPKLFLETVTESYAISLDHSENLKNNVKIQTECTIIGEGDELMESITSNWNLSGKTTELCHNISLPLSGDHWRGLLVEGKLRIQVIIKYLDLKNVSTPIDVFQRVSTYCNLIDNAKADFKIVTSEGLAIGVHKLILENVWPYFATMVNMPLEESKKSKWLIADYNYTTIKTIVVFMYTGFVELEIVQVALCVLKAAHQYQIDNLVTRAEQFIRQNIEIELVLDILSAAALFDLEDLKKSCFEKIACERKNRNSIYKTLKTLPGYDAFNSTVDYDHKTIKIIVAFLYTGQFEMSDVQVALGVLKAGHQYQINNVVKRAERFIKRNMKIDFVLEILSTAALFGLDDLKKSCLKKIARVKKDPNSKYKPLNTLPGYKAFNSTASRELLAEFNGKVYNA